MSAKLPKTPQFSPMSVEGKGESTKDLDEVIDTPEALRRLAKRVKDILEGMSGEANAFEHSGDHAGIDNSRPNDNWAVPKDDTLFDMSNFGCHEHIEETKETKEQKDERVLLNGTPSIIMVGAKLAETWETGTTADGTTENLPRKSQQLP